MCVTGAWADDTYEYYHNGSTTINTSNYFSGIAMSSAYNNNMTVTFNNAANTEITSAKFAKLESGTSISFTTTRISTVMIIALTKSNDSNNGIKLDNTAGVNAPTATFTTYTETFTNVAAGNHSIVRVNKENAVVYVKVVEQGELTSPIITVNPTSVSIKATESETEVTEDITVTGTNLTGNTLLATLNPSVTGLSVNLGSNTITNGSISTTATLRYTQTVNASGSTTLTLSDGTTTKDIAVNYKSTVVPTELVAISGATTLELKNTGEGLADVTPDDYVVLADAGSEASFADKLAVKGVGTLNVTWRKDAVQAGFFKFKTTVPGTVKVTFSDTGGTAGGDRAPRYANVNGTRSNVSSNGSGGNGAQVTCSPIAVEAGEVIIKGEQYNSGDDNYTDNQIRVFTITFIPTIKITTVGWATYCSPFALDFSNTGATVYTAARNTTTNNITLSEVSGGQVPANTGVILYKENGGDINPAVIAYDNALENNELVGIVEDTPVAYGPSNGKYNYIMEWDDTNNKIKFSKAAAANGAILRANKAYLSTAYNVETGEARALSVSSDAVETTSIDNVQGSGVKTQGYYNLNGQRVSQPTKGLYIVNGRKVVVK